jgi:hypothetical protein
MKTRSKKSSRQLFKDDLVTVLKFGNSIEANLAKTKLDSQRIASYVFDENMISLNPTLDLALGGVRLKVKKSELQKASRILGQRTQRSFWAPNKTFFFTYFFGVYLPGILALIIGGFLFLCARVFENLNLKLILSLNISLFGMMIFIYPPKLPFLEKTKNSSKRSKTDPEYAKLIGSIIALIGLGETFFKEQWFSDLTITICVFSCLAWFFIFRSLQNPKKKEPL